MKLFSSISLIVFISTLTYAQSTMCFKENHTSMSTIENVALDGGECKSTLTVNQMKEKGWKVDDIKITTKENKYNFIYIFKKNIIKENPYKESLLKSNQALENRILKKLEEKNIQKVEKKKVEKRIKSELAGKKMYISKCQSCHGQNGEKSVYDETIPLKDMSLDDMSFAINRYTNDHTYGYGYNTIMAQIASNIVKADLEKMKNYLNSINK